jgi:hypothetical protein
MKRAAFLDREAVRRYLTSLNTVVYDIQDPAISAAFYIVNLSSLS